MPVCYDHTLSRYPAAEWNIMSMTRQCVNNVKCLKCLLIVLLIILIDDYTDS